MAGKRYQLHREELKYEESRLVSMLAEDSEYAFQLVYDRHRKRIYQTALRYLKSPILAQEVVQDVFLKLWFNRKSLRTDHPLEAWLYTLTKNNLLNRLKKIANEWQAIKGMGAVAKLTENNVAARLEESQYQQLLQQALAALPQQQRTVFLLAREQQLTYIEIGEKMGISPLTVKTHMARALASIKKWFSDKGIIISASVFLLLL